MKMIDRFNVGVDFGDLYDRDSTLEFCVLMALRHAVGQENRLTRSELVRSVHLCVYHLRAADDGSPSERKIRNAVRFLRREGALIISTGGKQGGYWRAESLAEVDSFCESEYESRAMDMLVTSSRMKAAAAQKFGGQVEMFLDPTKIILRVFDDVLLSDGGDQ